MGPGFGGLFNLKNGPLVACYSALLLILAGQYALLIYWARSHSTEDFGGRFRLWNWVALTWFTYAFCLSTEGHLAWTQSVLWFLHGRHIEVPRLCWLIPAAAVGGEFLWLLHRDMRNSRLSAPMLWLAAAVCLTAGVLPLVPNATVNALVGPALIMGGPLCLFVSMLLHARHVVHLSAEPPPLRRFRLPFRLPRLRLPHLRFPRIRLRRSGSSGGGGAAADRGERAPRRSPGLASNRRSSSPSCRAA